MNSPNPHHLLSLQSSFTPNLKHRSSTTPILIYPLLPTSLPVSTPNTIHHSRLTVLLPDSLYLTCCLSILSWTFAFKDLTRVTIGKGGGGRSWQWGQRVFISLDLELFRVSVLFVPKLV